MEFKSSIQPCQKTPRQVVSVCYEGMIPCLQMPRAGFSEARSARDGEPLMNSATTNDTSSSLPACSPQQFLKYRDLVTRCHPDVAGGTESPRSRDV